MIYKTILTPEEASKDFLENEKQFHLGVIPTEQSNPITKNLSATIARSTAEGIKLILAADKYIPAKAKEAFHTPEFEALVDAIVSAMNNHKTVLFSSVGASGRMAIQLDAAWRYFWTSLTQILPAKKEELMKISEVTNSHTTGGDRALVHSVENFEDYLTFGRQQVIEANVGPGDVVVALAECGLSASVNGAALQGQENGCKTFYLYCNPKEILYAHLDRVKESFDRPDIIKIPLFVGNMAVAGSTRMQVTTVELLVAGAALEAAAYKWMQQHLTEDELKVVNVAGKGALDLDAYADAHQDLLDQLSQGAALEGLTKAVELEYNTYMEKGLVTYLTHDYLLDIMTDTTERQPTFTLPPFKKFADKNAQVSWAYVKDPLYPNTVAWQHLFRRPIKGLEWGKEDYIRMNADQQIINNPPHVSGEEVLDYDIGNEVDESRYSRKPARLLCMDINNSANKDVLAWFNNEKGNFSEGYVIRFGEITDEVKNDKEIHIPVKLPRTCTDLMTHLLIKLSFNLMSTATMAKMGRVFGNWMVQVLPTNKKLIDRSTRIIANLAKIPYEQANLEFFKSYYNRKPEDEYKQSYVVETLLRLGFDPTKDIE